MILRLALHWLEEVCEFFNLHRSHNLLGANLSFFLFILSYRRSMPGASNVALN